MAVVRNDNWIRRFEVTDPRKHKKGFTVYKVTSVVFPRSAPEASTSVTVWKRYNDFKKLYESLKCYHKQFRINEELPQLYKGKFFERFEENVIKCRINFALELLNFIGRHKILFTSDPFMQFFNSGYQITESTSLAGGNIEICVNGNKLDVTAEFTQTAVVKRNSLTPALRDLRLSKECTFTNCECSDEENNLTSDTSDSVSPIHSANSLLTSEERLREYSNCNVNNFDAALDIAEHPDSFLNERMGLLEEKKTEENNLRIAKPMTHIPDNLNKKEAVTCHSEKPVQPIELCISVRTEDFRSITNSLLAPVLSDGEPGFTPLGTNTERQDYIVEAAYHVGQAQKYEIDGEYEAAFCFYKAAIACLLSGVQDDEDKAQRQAVREKTNQYLQRAEKIYALHIAPNRKIEPKKVTQVLEELKIYKVLRVIDSVMLVLNTTDDKHYVIKVLQKSPCPVDLKKKTTIPHNVPYMVKLIKYCENENSIFLVLEYASGGKLWDHLNDYSNLKSEENGFSCRSSQHESIFLSKNDKKFDSEKCFMDVFTEYQRKDDIKIGLPSYINGNLDGKVVPSVELHLAEESLVFTEFDDRQTRRLNSIQTHERIKTDNVEVMSLVKNSQKLLNSVSKTLQNSEKLTSNLSKELTDIETVFDLKCRFMAFEKDGVKLFDARNKKRSRSAVLKSKFERSFSTEDLSDSRSRTASSSIDRRGEWSKLATVVDSSLRLSESIIREWAAELLVALETLHRWGIICRDLHPGNILLGEGGHILLTFQAHWEGVDSPISEESLSGLYAAPENMSVFPITPATDWWSLGALLFYLLTGKTLSSCYPEGILGHTILTFPDFLSPEACSLLVELLKYEPNERLGSGVTGVEEIKCHPFFSFIDWQVIYENC